MWTVSLPENISIVHIKKIKEEQTRKSQHTFTDVFHCKESILINIATILRERGNIAN